MKLVLADTSVWVDHIRTEHPRMLELSDQERLLTHVHVIGELSVGNLRDRANFLHGLRRLDRVVHARDEEVARMVEQNRLYGLGISWADAHLLASTLLMDDVLLWTRDRRLNTVAARFGRAFDLHH